MGKEPPKNVQKLITEHKQKPKVKRSERTTLPGKFARRHPKPKTAPTHVLTLIAQAMGRKKKGS